MTQTQTTTAYADAPADVVAERIFALALAGAESMSVYVGDRLGWYRALAIHGPATSGELAQRTATHERYVREWLEQQAVCGILVAREEAAGRRYELPAGAAEALTDETSLSYLGPLPRIFAATSWRRLPFAGCRCSAAGMTGHVLCWKRLSSSSGINRVRDA